MEFINELLILIHSEHPFILLTKDILRLLSKIWHYVIFRADTQPIAVSNIVIGGLLFYMGLRFARFLSYLISHKAFFNYKVDKHTATTLERISYYTLILIIAFFVLEVTNVPLTALTVVGTTLALGIGLGSQDIANNFISGLMIMIEKPIKLGDIIEAKGVIGKVINIGARSVSLQTTNNINMLIPNSKILQDSIINWTLNDPTIQLALPIKIECDKPLTIVEPLLLHVLEENPHILKEPRPKMLLQELDGKYYGLELMFWINLNNETDRKIIINQLNRAIELVFKTHDIKLFSKKD